LTQLFGLQSRHVEHTIFGLGVHQQYLMRVPLATADEKG
jgi:hypothetical protein